MWGSGQSGDRRSGAREIGSTFLKSARVASPPSAHLPLFSALGPPHLRRFQTLKAVAASAAAAGDGWMDGWTDLVPRFNCDRSGEKERGWRDGWRQLQLEEMGEKPREIGKLNSGLWRRLRECVWVAQNTGILQTTLGLQAFVYSGNIISTSEQRRQRQ